jgi:hypothetical protein
MLSVKSDKGTGKFQSLSKAATPVPGNFLTQSYLRFAYGVPKETFRRWMGGGSEFPVTIPHNKGKSIIENIEMAETYFTPLKLFLEHEMSEFNKTDEGKIASRAEKTKHRAFLKEHFKQLPKDIMDVYLMKVRERLAYHGFVKEALVDTLNDNNEQAFRQLDKVSRCLTPKAYSFFHSFVHASYVACKRMVLVQDHRELAEKP